MLLKKTIFLIILLIAFSFSAKAVDEPTISAKSAVVINAQTKEIFYSKNAYEKRSMASTTKIMTSLLAVESGMLGSPVKASNFTAEGTSIGLKNGYILRLETLVYGMLLESGNDAAKLTANFLAGDEINFAFSMNEKAKSIGMNSTNFVTASGLDDENHYSTAYDMALLGAYAINNPIFKEICSTKTKRVEYIDPSMTVTFSNHNRLLDSCEGVFGIKTGFTKKSGRCLVTACCRNDMTFVAVTLNASDDWNDHKKLYDYVYETLDQKVINADIPGEMAVYGGEKSNIVINTPKAVFALKSNEKIKQKVLLPRILYAPISKGDVVGKVLFYSSQGLVHTENIYSTEDVKTITATSKISFFQRIKNKIFQ